MSYNQTEESILLHKKQLTTFTKSAGLAVIALLTAAPSAQAQFSADFTTSNGGFVSTIDGAANDWVRTNGTGWSVDAVTPGTPGNNSKLTSSTLIVTSDGAVELNFDHAFSFEADWDGGAVYVNVNGGGFTYLDKSAFSVNGYDSTVALLGAHGNTGQFAFSIGSAGYPNSTITSSASLGNFTAGDTIQVQFLGAWDQFANNATGGTDEWIISSVEVTNTEVPEPASLSLLALGGLALMRRRR
jgi:hypothetical protein